MNPASRFGARLGTTVAGASLLIPTLAAPALAAPTVVAPEPTLVNLLGCQLFEDGATTVEPGSDVTLRLPGFASGNYGLIRVMVGAATATLGIDPGDGPAANLDVTDTFTVTTLSPTYVVARPANLHLGSLEPGQYVDLLYRLEFSHPVAILYPPVGPSGDNGPYLTEQEDDVACRITASP